jgi:hypothetical protein
MPATSQIIIPSNTHTGLNSNLIEIVSEAFKGDGYYGLGDGLHTVSYQVTSFVGTIKMQATLSAVPGENDWFDLDGTTIGDGVMPYTTTSIYNFIGNFVWVRAVVNYTAGTVNSILYNH